jgi:hypothetical protein
LTVLGTSRPLDAGRPVERDGRTFYAGRYGARDIVSVRLPTGVWVEAEVPNPPGWSLRQPVALLAGVRVVTGSPGASR